MRKALTILGVLSMVPALALAGPFPPNVANDFYSGVVNGIPTANGDNLVDIYQAINDIQNTAYTANRDVDSLLVELDEIWEQLDGSIALIGLTTTCWNSIGLYMDPGVGANRTALLEPWSGFGFAGDGTASAPYPAVKTSLGTGTNFGWYLNSDPFGIYYSEAALNSRGWDHMMTFDLPGARGRTIYVDYGTGATAVTLGKPYLVAWEDMPWDGLTLGDEDYDDIIYLFDKVAPIPEPSTVLLFGLGTLILRKRKKWA